VCAYRDLRGCGGSVRRVAPEGSAAVGPGAGPATPVREERDQNHCAQVGCVLSWLVATRGHCLRVGASCHGVRGERPIERCG
jgi:hypothetical protein